MRRIVTLCMASIIALCSYSQESEEIISAKNEFGAHAGFTTGMGLSYRHWFNRVGVQLTAIPIKTNGEFFGSAGVTGLYSLKRTKYVSTYLYLGNHVYVSDRYEAQYDFEGNYMSDEQKRDTKYNIGFGPGFSFGRTVTFSLMVGYAVYDVTDKVNLLPTVEYGVYYMF